ncbi:MULTISPECIES: nitroreductase family deazaflavin-dependent oxidoreductase [unclassified Streptomyces]|uniref:nitroreductase family deazaflavin-dependent oxidoreductase n=1 Tax=unclassified Streptomyces TaxID=2593676 RepID=UPI0011CE8814|nr:MULTISPECIES: nitroreductase family deazaflavin-dependent oxidoreductase [unclassified Streptomyces]TXS76629.1 nitroreductase family deazaflavin-dependent oxidoreductase [Streptomyces sp. me109]
MPLNGEYEPSATEWVREQVAQYEATDGAEGGTFLDLPVIILTTKGAKSGKIRKMPLMRVEHDGSYAVAASNGGADTHPSWYRNVVSHPLVEVQDHAVKRDMIARELQGEEKAAWWKRADAAYPPFVEYRAGTERDIPLFVLEPVADEG